jgi:polyphosphate kinase 2 (PPK2 family)
MSIDLTQYEAGDDYDGRYRRDLAALQKRLEHIQVAHIVNKRPAVVMLEGWDAAGKGGIIQRLSAEWDPRTYRVWPIAAPSSDEKAHHFLWRFWQRLPADGSIAVFDRSWYGRVLVERVEQFASEAEWRRAYDAINAFEAELLSNDTTLIKIFVHITQEEQDRRLKARLGDPWKHWKTGLDDYHNRSRRAEYLEAMHEMFERTDTAEAPWVVIDGNDKKAARIAALRVIADRLEAGVRMVPPPLDPAVLKVAKKALKL